MTGLFAEPGRLLWLLAVAGWGFLAWWRHGRDYRELAKVGDPALVGTLTGDIGRTRRRKDTLCAVALVLAVLAFARPQLGSRMSEVKRRGNDIFVCVDTSASMSAEDVAPTRMDAAKRSLSGLISMLKGDRVGIVAFAGKAFLQCPLTMDTDAARLFLDSVGVGAVPVPGTALGDAVRSAVKRFPKSTRAKKFIVLLTDGEDHGSDPLDAAREAKKAGVVIYAVGLGTPQGELLRERDGGGGVTGFKKDEKGETVVSRLDEGTLAAMAEITGGKYVRGGDDSAVAGLAGEVSSLARETMAGGIYRVREDRYQWPLLFAVLLLMAEFAMAFRAGHWAMVWREFRAISWELPWKRRGGAAAVLLCAAAMLAANPARADFKSLMNEGNRLCKEGKFEEARQKYFSAEAESPGAGEARYNVANSWLYEGNSGEALKAYDEAEKMARHPLLKSMIAYNRGWAYATEGKNAEAVEAFKEALRWNPGDMDAKYNIEWLKSGKQEGKPQPGKGQARPGEGKGPKEGMSREDAERLLEMARGKEQQLRDQKKQKQKEQKEAPGGKDW